MSLVPAFRPEPAVSPSWARSCDPTIRAARSVDCWLSAKLQQWPWIRLPVLREALSGAAKTCNFRIGIRLSGTLGGLPDEIPSITGCSIVRRGDRVCPGSGSGGSPRVVLLSKRLQSDQHRLDRLVRRRAG